MFDFSSISQDFKNFVLADADTSMSLGDSRYLDQLGDPSLDHLRNTTAQAKTLLTTLEKCSVDSFDQKLDIDLMARYLKQQIFFAELEQSGQPQRCRKPGGV
ncbi:MAG: hypothetical protein ACJAR6_000664, partial [Oleispira sp.]